MSSPRRTVLLVEDNELDVEVVERLIRRSSLELRVVHAGDGEEALELLRERSEEAKLAPPLVLLLDIDMPRMTGLEFLAEMARDGRLPALPVFVLSTSNNPQERDLAESYGISGYLVKPLRAEQLHDVLAALEPPDEA